MPALLSAEINKLKKSILTMGAVVDERVLQSVKAVHERDERLAKKIIDGDPEVDRLEVDLEEECLKILALHQPVAIDLRFIVAVIKINSDLERIADLAVNIAERVAFLATQARIEVSPDLSLMSEKVKIMMKKCLDAFVNMDSALAKEVIPMDDVVDDLNRSMFKSLERGMVEKPERIGCLIHILSVSRYLERIADHATNIAEDVIYMIEGEIVRHQPDYGSTVRKGS
jgi:phosphate transport system protein